MSAQSKAMYWQARAMELEALLAQGLKLMELINGPENKCVYEDGARNQCKNHQWINEAYAAMKEGK